MSDTSLLMLARQQFHKTLIDEHVLSVNEKGVPSNADKSSRSSVAIANGIYRSIGANSIQEKLPGQTSGNKFEHICAQFVNATFPKLTHLRPGKWNVIQSGGRNRLQIAEFQ